MKAVLISIQPKWCELIAQGEKTVEVRKTKPKIETPFKCYIYCTNAKGQAFFTKGENGNYAPARWGKGKVIAEFVCDTLHEFTKAFFDEQEPQDTDEIQFWLEQFKLSYSELCSYVGTKDFYGWHISDLVIYDKPKELSEFKRICDGNCQTCQYAIWQKDGWAYKPYIVDCKPITRPPQSWCYVERSENGN